MTSMRFSSAGTGPRVLGRTTSLVFSAVVAVAAAGCGLKASTPVGSGGMSVGGMGGGGTSGGAPGGGGADHAGGNGGTASGGTADVGGASAFGGASGVGGDGSDGGGSGAAGGAAAGGAVAMGEGGSVGGSGLGGTPASGGAGGRSTDPMLAKFSFFVTSLPALVALSGKAEGFGGDLRFGKADGLSGADEICRQVAERGLAGAGQKQWRAFLSVNTGPAGVAVYARDRIGPGPWYDRRGRMLAPDLTGLFGYSRPDGDAGLTADMPNENGDPNHFVGPAGIGTSTFNNRLTLTGADAGGRLLVVHGDGTGDTCNDWTSTTALGLVAVGSSWGSRSWVYDTVVRSCAAGVDLSLGGTHSESVGSIGGYGGFYCFALP